jgi:hypothetical protein
LKTLILIAKNRDERGQLSSQLAGQPDENILIIHVLSNDFEVKIDKFGKE